MSKETDTTILENALSITKNLIHALPVSQVVHNYTRTSQFFYSLLCSSDVTDLQERYFDSHVSFLMEHSEIEWALTWVETGQINKDDGSEISIEFKPSDKYRIILRAFSDREGDLTRAQNALSRMNETDKSDVYE